MNKDNLIEFAKEQCEIFPEDSYMGEYLRETLKILQAEPCENAVSMEDVIKAVDHHTFDTDDGLCLDEDITIILEELPPVEHGCLHCQGKWIPVSERLPKPYTFVNATCRSLVDDRENWVVETLYLPIPKENNERGYSDWGDIPKFRNGLQIDENGKNIRGTGHMVFDWFKWEKDGKDIPKIHPSQKPVKLLKRLIETFTDEGDVVIDPCFGSGSTGRACLELNRNFYGFEINKEFYRRAKEEMCVLPNNGQMSIEDFI